MNAHHDSSQIVYKFFFTSDLGAKLLQLVGYDTPYFIISLESLSQDYDTLSVSYLDATYTQCHKLSIIQWCTFIGSLCQYLVRSSSCLSLITLWIHEKYLPSGILENCITILRECVLAPWCFHYSKLHAPVYGDPIDTSRYLRYISTTPLEPIPVPPPSPCGYDPCVSIASPSTVVIRNLPLPPRPHHHCDTKALISAVIHPSCQTSISS